MPSSELLNKIIALNPKHIITWAGLILLLKEAKPRL
jgi:hypothetical protein